MTPSLPLTAASDTAAVVVLTVSFSNLTDMAPAVDATATDSRWRVGGACARAGGGESWC